MVIILLVLHIALGIFALQVRDMLVAVIALAAVSLMSALLFFFLDAPDVALTEAAVGAGVTSFLFVWFVRKTERRSGE
ncbi:MAG: DUF4040 domain-containing protein [Spirochaetales bacterium]|nr:DUF4040 domain-containing protein [Spirochaetales bacterium]